MEEYFLYDLGNDEENEFLATVGLENVNVNDKVITVTVEEKRHNPRSKQVNKDRFVNQIKKIKEQGETLAYGLVFPPTLLLCSRRFLHALQQNRVQSRLLYLLS